ncbi:MAG: SLC13 family permease, partial [Planctomycetota bacterium]|nr:SLC13 family permease [Planctomycetota bacterium]
RHAPFAMAILLGMLVLMVGGWLPLVATVFLGALLMILTGCLSSRQAYSAINWQSLVLIAAMLPAAKAIEKTGGLNLIVEQFVTIIGPWGPGFVLAGLFLLTSVMSLLMSNTATSVILAPVAFQTAQSLGVQPEAFLMTVALAASTAFATPMASPVNTLVMSTGGYRFVDYLKLGLPLQFLIFVLTMIVVPLFFPFSV